MEKIPLKGRKEMKIGLSSYSMDNLMQSGEMTVLDVMDFAKEQGAENVLILCGLDSLASAPTFTGLLYKMEG